MRGPDRGSDRGSERGPERGAALLTVLMLVAIIAVILLVTGGFVQSLNFLLWVGIVLLVLAAIVWLVRMLTGRRSV